jgi:hypothetical protein
LRGAAKPCVLVEVMNKGSVQYDFFDFQRGSDPQNHGRIISDLKEILEARDPERENFRINVTDTAHGGQGINALVSALKEIKEGTNAFKKQIWNLDVHLLHTDEAKLSNILKVLGLQDSGLFQINLGLHQVPNLIFEDYDPALAVEMKGSHGRFLFKPCARPGRMLFRKNDEVFVIETDNTSLMLEEFLAESITANLLTSHTRVPAQDVWADYQNKA